MNVNDILNNDGYHAPNPAYKPGNGQPKYIITDDPTYAPTTSANMFSEAFKRGDLNKIGNVEDYKELVKYGITPREGESYNDYQRTLAERQSVLEKYRNAFIQTISEGTIGTVKAFADLFDLVTLAQMQKDSDYQNPISSMLEGWQKQIREATPIFQDPDVNILNGGLFDSGFIANGIPSIISSLTLMVPSKAVSYGLTKGVKAMTAYGIKGIRNIEKAHKAAKLGEGVEEASRARSITSGINAFRHGPVGQRVTNVADFTVSGLTSRLLENYQEGRQVYDEGKPLYKEILKGMSPEEREKTINTLKAEFGNDAADWNDNDSVAHLVAQKAADRTFVDDLANTFSDVYQMWAIGKGTRLINGPSRTALKRLNKQNIATVGKTKEEIDKLLASRSTLRKAGDKATDILVGGKAALFAEFNEGIEEAVNYIAQEEGFHYGKVLLNQEVEDGAFSDRLVKYMKSPQLYDSAFWGLVGGVVFNNVAENANRFTQAIDKIQSAKKINKQLVSLGKDAVPVPTFKQAFADTELAIRKANLQSNMERFNKAEEKLAQIEEGKDIFQITNNGKLETQEEKDSAKEILLRQFRDEILLDAMQVGNYNLAKEFLASDELKQAFVNGGHFTQEQANALQADMLSRGDELLHKYNKHLRNLYNAVADWGENNDKDLTEIPAEIFNLVVRENLTNELTEDYIQERIGRLERENAILENDSRDELNEAARNNGITDFKSIAEYLWNVNTLGQVNAEIADIKAKKQHTTATGQALLREKENLRDTIVKNLEDSLVADNDTQTAANILLAYQSASAVELLSSISGEHLYTVNPNNDRYQEILNAVQKKDRKILETLSPTMKSILDRNAVEEDGTDNFLQQVKDASNVRDNIINGLYDNKGNMTALKDINEQLHKNYSELALLKINKTAIHNRIARTKEQILSNANDIANTMNMLRAKALDDVSLLYQQLSKKYGTDAVKQEVDTYVRTGEHTDLYEQFDEDEKGAFDFHTNLVKFNQPNQDLALRDVYRALNYNDIYTYSKKDDIVEKYKEDRRKAAENAAQNSTTFQNSNSATNQQQSNNQSEATQNASSQPANGQTANVSPQNQSQQNQQGRTPVEDEETEGTIEVEDGAEPESNAGSNKSQRPEDLSDEELNGQIANLEYILNDTSIPDSNKSTVRPRLKQLQEEKAKREAASSSSTGVLTATNPTLDQVEVYNTVKGIVDQLSESNPSGLTVEDVKNVAKQAVQQQFPSESEDVINDLVDSAIAIVDRKLKRKGESIDSALAKNVIKLSRIAYGNASEAIIKEARAVLDRTFDDILDIFNNKLSRGKVRGKYIIPLESLLRYARAITNNEYDAQEMYNSFVRIIADNPKKYTIIKHDNVVKSRIIKNITSSLTERTQAVESKYGGLTFDFATALENLNDEEKEKALAIIQTLKPNDVVIVKLNYKNSKKRKYEEGYFPGGIDFIVNGTIIASMPTAALGKDSNHWMAMQDGWHYQIPFLEGNKNSKEYPIQTFFKKLFIDDSAKAKEFRDLLREYECYGVDESNDKDLGLKTILEANDALEAYARENGINLSGFVQRGTNNEQGKIDRIRHLAKLDIYTQDKFNLYLEENNYDDEIDNEDRNNQFRESIDQWFNKVRESSEARKSIENRLLEKAPNSSEKYEEPHDVGVRVNKVGKQVLVVTKPENAKPATQALSAETRKTAKLAAGDPNNKTQVVVSNGEPMAIGSQDTTGRSVVIVDNPEGEREYINAYPVQVNHSVFRNNAKLSSFRDALIIKLEKLLDNWYSTSDSSELVAFLDSIGHKSKDTRKIGSSLFAGFTRYEFDNGFYIRYKEVNGKIVSPSSKEDGVVHRIIFYDSVNTKKGKKSRAAVQHQIENQTGDKAVIWNTNPNDVSNMRAIASMKKMLTDVLIDSLNIRIDPSNINADSNSTIAYGPLMSRDADGNFVLRITDIADKIKGNPNFEIEGNDAIIKGVGNTFSDFILDNNLVNLTTEQINGSNFSTFNNRDGQYGVTYRVGNEVTSPVEETTKSFTALSSIVEEAVVKTDNKNKSKELVRIIINSLPNNNSLKTLTRKSKLVDALLHKNVIFVDNFNNATYVDNEGNTVKIPDEAYAAYMPADLTITVNGKEIKINQGDIVVGNRFMELLDGDVNAKQDALHHLLHENVHAYFADNNIDKALTEKYKKELEEIWDEYTKKYPDSAHARTNDALDLEEFIVESLTNPELIRELNDTLADKPLNNPKDPKTLLGKLFKSLVNWLSDILGKDFKVNKDSLFAKEYAIFEEFVATTPKETKNKRNRNTRKNNNLANKKNNKPTEGTLRFKEDVVENTDEVSDSDIENMTITISNPTAKSNLNNLNINDDGRTASPKRPRNKFSTIGMSFPNLQGALNSLDGDTYFDVKDKINNGVISIKCN